MRSMLRRSWLKGIGGLVAAPRGEAAEIGSVVASRNTAVTETAAGKVRGYVRKGIYTFKGIPYAAPAGGAQRFMPPAKPKPWGGVRSSLTYGFVSPQAQRDQWTQDELAWVFAWNDGMQGEDCLRVNVWTPGLNDNGERPVMVWLHGGGFSTGSGHELPSYDGENLARRGNVVVVTLNHRLGPMGYLNLAQIGGERYAASANAGMLDLVAALEWVRDNIGAFGGDAGNVTIFGQSGGGGKVNALMAMPRAKGLFHKAIVQSGSLTRMASPENSARLAAAVLAELDIAGGADDRFSSSASCGPASCGPATKGDGPPHLLHTVPFEKIIAAGVAAAKKVFPQVDYSRPFDFKRHGELIAWAPTVDGGILPEHPFDRAAPVVSARIPLLVGSTLNEFAVGFDNPAFEALSEKELMRRIAAGHGADRADAIVQALRRGHPGAKPCDLFTIWFSSGVRRGVIDQALLKSAQGTAPVYVYNFAWQTPVLDARPRAFHTLELPFVFDNTDRCETATGGGAAARALAAKISAAWIQFARTGDPNHRGLPAWPAFNKDKRTTMMFDNTCAAMDDPDGEELTAISAGS